jgi:hypothetical protein
MKEVDVKAGWASKKTYCTVEQPEINYRPPIWVLVIAHFLLFIGLTAAVQRGENAFFWPIVMDFNKIRSKDLLDDFYGQYKKNIGVLILYLAVVFTIAFYWMMSISIDYDKVPECHKENHRRMHSICNAWLVADALISFGTVFAVAFEFHVGSVEFTRKVRNRIQFAHLFAVDKFLKSDPYAGKDNLVNLSLDNKLKNIV